MYDFAFYLISGISYGAIIALIALGYTLVYGIIKLINFAHGEFFMAGAYAGLGFSMLLPPTWSPWFQIPIVLIVSGLVSSGIAGATELIAYRPIRKSGRLAALLTAIGVSFLLQKIFAFVKNAQTLNYDSSAENSIGALAQTSVHVGGNGFAVINFFYLFITAVLTTILWYIVMKTKYGKAMRALSQDADAAALMGINVNNIIRNTFLLGGFLAGVAGTLVAFKENIQPSMGVMPGLLAFIAAVIGGIGSIPGAVIGGFIIGILSEMLTWAGVPSAYNYVALFVLLIVILVLRPQGILGKVVREKV